MSRSTKVVEDFIATFMAAWPTADGASLASFFTADAVYHNMPMEPIEGREAITATLTAFMGMGGRVAVDMIHIVAKDEIVMTERVDHLIKAEGTISLPVMGIFEVRHGEIAAWRDYFDPSHLNRRGKMLEP